MKKVIPFISLLFLLMPATTEAQTAKEHASNFGDKISNVWRSTRRSVSNALGISTGEDLIRVSGKDYMPVYGTNIYEGENSDTLRKTCEKLFTSKYPKAKILSVSLPQTEWLSHAIEQKSSIIGYVQTMYCYVLASDGSDGYINARFAFRRSRDVGETYRHVPDDWPRWERTDIMTTKTYNKLLKKLNKK